MKKKLVIAGIFVALFSYYLSHWIGCRLDERFFFSPLNLTLRIIFDIRSNQTTLPFIARLLHNKITQGSIDVFNAYGAFWDIRFLMLLISPFGALGLFSWFYYAAKKGIKLFPFEKLLVGVTILFPLVLLFGAIKQDMIGLGFFALLLAISSLRGLYALSYFSKHAVWILFVTLLFSIWYILILGNSLTYFCHA